MSYKTMIPEEFLSHLKKTLEIDSVNCSPFFKHESSTVLFKISDGNEYYVVKIYQSAQLFNTELFILTKWMDSVKIPQLVYYEDQTQSEWNWIVYQYIEGKSLFDVKEQLNKTDFQRLFFELGQELKKIHDIKTIHQFTEIENQKNIDRIIAKTENNYHYLDEGKNSTFFQKVIQFLRNNYLLLGNINFYSIIIKDFNDKHIIMRKDNKYWTLNGIVDFEQAVYSNIFCDFVSLYIDYFLDNEDFESAFLKGYNIDIHENEQNLIAFFILQYALELYGILKDVHSENKMQGEMIISKVFDWLKNNTKFYYR